MSPITWFTFFPCEKVRTFLDALDFLEWFHIKFSFWWTFLLLGNISVLMARADILVVKCCSKLFNLCLRWFIFILIFRWSPVRLVNGPIKIVSAVLKTMWMLDILILLFTDALFYWLESWPFICIIYFLTFF